MKRKARKVGGSIYVAIPSGKNDELGINEGDEVDVRLKGKSIIITKIEESVEKCQINRHA